MEVESKPKKNYYLIFKEKNNEKIKEIHKCEICERNYTYFNKSKHLKSKYHLKFKSLNDEIQKLKNDANEKKE